MCPRADLRLYGKARAARGGPQSMVHHAQYRCHDIRVVATQNPHGWQMTLHILHQGKRVVRLHEPAQLYLDFAHARIAGLLLAYETLDLRLGEQCDRRPESS
ncbi:hypothetical protein [Herbaspirillum robiniae]|uniref:Uncharacterized protein n=1 Tax=Herbaspirillum robiniae TaxID=2014887 RepID=A0A246WM33_9BURK|nr:hypothetical protein [Herbaspirillum robiniae]OWY27400.1 hypothetical protein CEJ42_20360 [Herbaspirillum robiniae]